MSKFEKGDLVENIFSGHILIVSKQEGELVYVSHLHLEVEVVYHEDSLEIFKKKETEFKVGQEFWFKIRICHIDNDDELKYLLKNIDHRIEKWVTQEQLEEIKLEHDKLMKERM